MQQQACPHCNRIPLIRFHKDGQVYCNSCDEPLLINTDNWSGNQYVKCPNPECGYEGEELKNPEYATLCPRCNSPVMHQ